MERKTKRELDKQLAVIEAEAHIQKQALQAAAAHQAKNACVVATFENCAKEAAIVVGATPEIAEATPKADAAEAETAIADAMAMEG
jgi:hypothetical protein